MKTLAKISFALILPFALLSSCSKYTFTPKYSSPPPGYYDEITIGTVYNGNLIVAGNFTTLFNSSNNIAQWNRKIWSGLGSGLACNFQGQSLFVYAMTAYNGNLIVGGIFSSAGGQTVNDIAQWNGSSWSPMGNGQFGGGINALVVYNGNLIAGGDFSTTGSFGIAQWNGTSWSTMGSNLSGIINTLVVYKGTLIAGGNNIGTTKFPAQWNGTTWSSLGTGCNDAITSLIVYNGNLIAQGVFDTIGGIPAAGIAQWNGTTWSALSNGMYTPLTYNGDFYNYSSYNISYIDSVITEWNPISSSSSIIGTCSTTKDSANNPNYESKSPHAFGLCVYDSSLIIGGWFTSVNGVITKDNLGKWNGNKWSSF